jgi:hypothetical protein
MKPISIPSLHVHGSKLAKISNSQKVRFIHHVCLVHIKTAILDLSKRQYESNFQKENPVGEAPGSKTQAEKVIVQKSSENVRVD